MHWRRLLPIDEVNSIWDPVNTVEPIHRKTDEIPSSDDERISLQHDQIRWNLSPDKKLVRLNGKHRFVFLKGSRLIPRILLMHRNIIDLIDKYANTHTHTRQERQSRCEKENIQWFRHVNLFCSAFVTYYLWRFIHHLIRVAFVVNRFVDMFLPRGRKRRYQWMREYFSW